MEPVAKGESMMSTFFPNSALSQKDTEEQWSFADSIRIAETEFSKSRRRAAMRELKRRVEDARGSMFASGHGGDRFPLPLPRIDGMVLPSGGLTRGLPPLPRRMKRAWVESFARVAIGDGATPFSFRLVDGGLYLEGGLSALLRLEITRARGEESVLAIIVGSLATGCEGCAGIPTCPLAS